MAGRKKGIKRRLMNLFIGLVFLAGAGILAYPTVSDLWNQYRNAQLISTYDQAVEELEEKDYTRLWEEARAYNAAHKVNTIVDAFNENNDYELSHPYDTVLDPNGDGLMGSIEIPKIQVKMAIYHGLGETALERGAGHVEGTSLPIGGPGTHAALAAHRGLPSAKLFTDLDQLEKGDIFILNILGEKLAYKVTKIKTVLPEETKDLAIKEGKDLVTLITCTPYGVNTHRILVRGKRTEYVEEIEEEIQETVPQQLAKADPVRLLITGCIAFVVLATLLGLILRRKPKKRNDQEGTETEEAAGKPEDLTEPAEAEQKKENRK